MTRLFTFIATLIFSLQLASTAVAIDVKSGWVVERASTSVWKSLNGKDWEDLKTGDVLAASAWIQTGRRGQIILARGAERIVYRPETIAQLSNDKRTTTLRTSRGSVLLSIDPRRGGRTFIQTRHLAAVVLGTVLEVSTNEATSSLRVDKGRVQVRNGGQSVVLTKGQKVDVQSDTTAMRVEAAIVTSVVPTETGLGLVVGAPVELAANNAADAEDTGSSANASGNSNGNSGNGNGNSGNGNGNNGNGNGNSGNGNGNSGNGNGNSGNGNGNSGNGNGNG